MLENTSGFAAEVPAHRLEGLGSRRLSVQGGYPPRPHPKRASMSMWSHSPCQPQEHGLESETQLQTLAFWQCDAEPLWDYFPIWKMCLIVSRYLRHQEVVRGCRPSALRRGERSVNRSDGHFLSSGDTGSPLHCAPLP